MFAGVEACVRDAGARRAALPLLLERRTGQYVMTASRLPTRTSTCNNVCDGVDTNDAIAPVLRLRTHLCAVVGVSGTARHERDS